VNDLPHPTPAERLTDLSLRLGSGADAWEADDTGWWLPAPLVALIVSFIKEIAESLATLAALIRDGKLVPQPPSAPRQGSHRPSGKASTPASESSGPAPVPAEAAQWQFPRAEPDMAAAPATSAEPASATPQGTRPQATKPPTKPLPAPKTPKLPPVQAQSSGRVFLLWPGTCPSPKTTSPKPAPWHAPFVAYL